MTPNVICVGIDEPVLKAARLMLQNRISGLPVLNKEGELVGIVTEGDFLRRGELGTQRHRPKWLEFILGPGRLAQEYVHTAGRKVEEIMTPDPCTIDFLASHKLDNAPRCLTTRTPTAARGARNASASSSAVQLSPLVCGVSSSTRYRGSPFIKFIFRKSQRQTKILYRNTRDSRLDPNQIASTRCNAEQDKSPPE